MTKAGDDIPSSNDARPAFSELLHLGLPFGRITEISPIDPSGALAVAIRRKMEVAEAPPDPPLASPKAGRPTARHGLQLIAQGTGGADV